MADVYCAHDSQLGRQIALKMLHRRFARDHEFVERFRREASAAAGLQHPNVVGVFDRGEYDGTYYIAMEYLPGRTLKDLIREEAPLDQERAIDLRHPDPPGGQLRAPARRDPPRLQAAQRDRRRRRPAQGHGLRHRPRRRLRDDRDRLDHGHRAVPLARAGPGPARRARRRTSTRSAWCSSRCSPAACRSRGESAVSIALKHVSEEPPPLRQLRPDVAPAARAGGRPGAARRTRRSATRAPTSSSPRSSRRAPRSRRATTSGGTSTFVPRRAALRARPARAALAVRGARPGAAGAGARGGALAAVVRHAGGRAEGRGQERHPRATAELERDGFKVTTHGVQSSKKPGTVRVAGPGRRRRRPTRARRSTSAVSSGPGQQLVPTVREPAAPSRRSQALNQAGFKVAEDPQPSATVAEGARDQDLAAGGHARAEGHRRAAVRQLRAAEGAGAERGRGRTRTWPRGTLEDQGFKVTRAARSTRRPRRRARDLPDPERRHDGRQGQRA